MSLEISLVCQEDAIEIRLSGVADPDLLARLGAAFADVAAREGSFIVSLDELSILGEAHLQALIGAIDRTEPGRLYLVCSRPTARFLLRRRRPATPVFADLSSALAAVRAVGP